MKSLKRKKSIMNSTRNRLCGFVDAIGNSFRVESRSILPSLGGFDVTFEGLDYCTPADSRREMINDLNNVKKDLNKSIKEAKQKYNNGETTTAK